jgi:hypothetical protein
LPPILTFQSVVDFTVSTNAIVSALYARLPSNGSERVSFDVTRGVKFGPLLRSSAEIALSRILPAGPQKYRTTIMGELLHCGWHIRAMRVCHSRYDNLRAYAGIHGLVCSISREVTAAGMIEFMAAAQS